MSVESFVKQVVTYLFGLEKKVLLEDFVVVSLLNVIHVTGAK